MSQVVNEQENASSLLKHLYEPIKHEMAEVERILQHELRSDYPFIDELVRYGCLLGGKRLRPALLLLTAKAVGQVTPEHLTLAAVIEMIHTATLVHDDVLDEADMRRHLDTCNARWDNEASVLLGDYLFTHSFYLASTLETTFACQTIGRATNTVCEGELRQVGARGNFELDESAYFQIIDAKTASLCACACQLGAHYAGDDVELTESMTGYGRDLGMAFQIADDLLDLLGNEASTGKSLGTDLDKQKPTLPLIHVLSQANVEDRSAIISIAQGSSTTRDDELMEWFERFDAIQYSQEKARFFADRAQTQIARLPESDAQRILMVLPDFVVARSR